MSGDFSLMRRKLNYLFHKRLGPVERIELLLRHGVLSDDDFANVNHLFWSKLANKVQYSGCEWEILQELENVR